MSARKYFFSSTKKVKISDDGKNIRQSRKS